MSLPLEGIRVLDLSRQFPGPYATMLLADLGADVIVVEDTGSGDRIRRMPPLLGEWGAAHFTLARNKRSVALNLKDLAGREALLRLARGADVVLEGFRPGVVDRLGVGYEAVRAVQPGIIYASITGFGQSGPYRDLAGHDNNYTALAGLLHITGPAGGPPVLPGVQVADFGGGALMAALAIMVALWHRQSTGQGQYIDVAMMDGILSWLAPHFAGLFAGGERPEAGKMLLTGKHPCYAIYPAKDGYLSVGALETQFWEGLCHALGREDLLPHQYAEGEVAEQTHAELSAIFRTRTRAEWFEALREVNPCVAPVQSLEEAADDPHAAARGMWVEVAHEQVGRVRQVAHPIKFCETPASIRRPAPTLGEQTREVLAEAGYTAEEVEALVTAGAAYQG